MEVDYLLKNKEKYHLMRFVKSIFKGTRRKNTTQQTLFKSQYISSTK